MPAAKEHPLLAHLARRVRGRRQEIAVTIRDLAEMANMSERYLVMLEQGKANISILNLEEVAKSLGTTASALLGDGPIDARVRPVPGGGLMISLIGLRGAGKTSIGQRAAKRLRIPFVELDALVAERAGMDLTELFELHGLAYYKKLEHEVLAKLIEDGADGVIATGGSIVTDQASFELLKAWTKTIWLKAKPEDHLARVEAQGDFRPMANRRDAMNELKALLRARRPLYERASHVVDTSALGLERAIDRVVRIAQPL
jgi:XRE family transcriptional regulator, aerobic/anaerobic benzoate catabolism transcriptional regulator